MKKATSLSLCATLAFAAAVVSCNRSDNNGGSICFDDRREAAAFTLDGSAEEYGTDANLRVACRANLLMPTKVYGNDVNGLQDTIRRMAFGSTDGVSLPQDYFRKSAGEFGFALTPLELTEAATDSLAASAAAGNDYDGFVSVEGYVQSLTQKILSYAVSTDSYAPHAAHGMYGISYVNYDIEGARVFGLSDIFTPEGLQALPGVIRTTAERMTGSIGSTTIETLPADNNFTVEPDGDVVFVYQPYEVASFAQGIINVPVPAYTVDSLLTDYGKQLLLSE